MTVPSAEVTVLMSWLRSAQKLPPRVRQPVCPELIASDAQITCSGAASMLSRETRGCRAEPRLLAHSPRPRSVTERDATLGPACRPIAEYESLLIHRHSRYEPRIATSSGSRFGYAVPHRGRAHARRLDQR